MKRWKLSFSWLVLFLSLLLSFSSQAQTPNYSRIISLKPNITEILFALGAGDRVVGVTTWCTRPEAAKKLPKVADYIQVFPEAALELRPDLIIGSTENSSQKEVYFLMDRGKTVKLFPFSTISETMQSIEAIGALVGKSNEAEKLTSEMRTQLKQLQNLSSALSKKRVLFVVGYQPLIVAGSSNFFDEAGGYVGADNVAHESRMKYPTYTTELMIQAQPEVIVDLAMGSENSESKRSERLEWWSQFASVPAVKNHQIYFFDIEKMRAVPTLPAALRELLQLLHPEAASISQTPQPLKFPLKAPRLVVKKQERRLLLYSEQALLRSYPIALGFQPNGTKTQQGDGKTPEGLYRIAVKNEASKFHLSLGLNYPNLEDGRKAWEQGQIDQGQWQAIQVADARSSLPPQNTALGGEIFIHGGGTSRDWTWGCIAMSNEDVEEVFKAVSVGTPVVIAP